MGLPGLMHSCLRVDEILRLTAHELVVPGAKTTTLAPACCAKALKPVPATFLEDTDPAISIGHSIYRKGSKETSVSVMDAPKHR